VIAHKPAPQPQQPRRQEFARDASRRRARRTQLHGYGMLGRIAGVLGIVLVCTISYVMLMANLTSQNYALARVTEHKLALQDETARLDDQIAHLRSRDRLADVAARLGMHDPQVFAVVDLPRPVITPPPNGIAFLGALFRH
jgi:cell division protein FtsL